MSVKLFIINPHYKIDFDEWTYMYRMMNGRICIEFVCKIYEVNEV